MSSLFQLQFKGIENTNKTQDSATWLKGFSAYVGLASLAVSIIPRTPDFINLTLQVENLKLQISNVITQSTQGTQDFNHILDLGSALALASTEAVKVGAEVLPAPQLKLIAATLTAGSLIYQNREMISNLFAGYYDAQISSAIEKFNRSSGDALQAFFSEFSSFIDFNNLFDNTVSKGFFLHVHRDPLVLDLDGDGLEAVVTDRTNSVMFDHK